MRLAPALIVLLLLGPVAAQDETAPIPRPRPAAATATATATEKVIDPAPAESQNPPQAAPAEVPIAPLPRPRPSPQIASPEVDKPKEANAPKPPPEPPEPRVYQTACPAVLSGEVEAKALPPLWEGPQNQCGLQSPLSVSGVLANGRMVPLSSAATLSCGMATRLPEWVSAVDSYLKAHDNTAVESLIVGTSYMCRNVNNGETGNLSDHSFADALDVVGFKLEDGRTITITQGWPGTEEQGSRIVRYAHDAACSLFMTTLGPEANALHDDHLHLDLLCHGKTCSARLCE